MIDNYNLNVDLVTFELMEKLLIYDKLDMKKKQIIF